MWLVMIVKTTDDGRIRAGIWIDPVISRDPVRYVLINLWIMYGNRYFYLQAWDIPFLYMCFLTGNILAF